MKLDCQHKGHKGQAVLRHYASQLASSCLLGAFSVIIQLREGSFEALVTNYNFIVANTTVKIPALPQP